MVWASVLSAASLLPFEWQFVLGLTVALLTLHTIRWVGCCVAEMEGDPLLLVEGLGVGVAAVYSVNRYGTLGVRKVAGYLASINIMGVLGYVFVGYLLYCAGRLVLSSSYNKVMKYLTNGPVRRRRDERASTASVSAPIINISTTQDPSRTIEEILRRSSKGELEGEYQEEADMKAQMMKQMREEMQEELSGLKNLLLELATVVNGMSSGRGLHGESRGRTTAVEGQSKDQGKEKKTAWKTPVEEVVPMRTSSGSLGPTTVPTPVYNRFAPLSWDEGEDETQPQSFPTLEAGVHVAKTWSKKQKKNPQGVGTRTQQYPTVEQLMAGLGKQEAEEMLEKVKKGGPSGPKPPAGGEYLSAEEKDCRTLEELHRRWKKERQQRMQEAAELRASDYDQLGELTEELKNMRKSDLRRLITDRRTEAWANRMRAKGVQIIHCETCGRLHTGDHRCVPTKWRTDKDKNIVIRQSPTSLNITTTQNMNPEQLQQVYESVKKQLEGFEFKGRLARPLEKVPSAEGDVRMAGNVVIDQGRCFAHDGVEGPSRV